jgi:hypothetical protein
MLPNRLEQIDEAQLLTLCEQSQPESQSLEFKRELPGSDDEAKAEFRKDVCALANSDGGDIVFGIADHQGIAGALAPIQVSSLDPTIRKLGQILDVAVEPRVLGVQYYPVSLSAGGYALVVRVPASFLAPHRFLINSYSRFVVRVGTRTVDLTYDQLRSAFDRTATLAEQTRKFRDQRLARIISGAGVPKMPEGPICVAHLIPIASIAGKVGVDVRALYNNYQAFMFRDWGGAARTLNLDGLLVHPGDSRKSLAYTQIFRSGALEAVRHAGALIDNSKVMPSGTLSIFIRDAISKFLAGARDFNIAGPAFAAISLLNVGQYEFAYAPRHQVSTRSPTDRENLILPDVWIERLEDALQPDVIVRPLLDVLWQSFDIESCEFYDPKGNWAPHF